MYRRRIRQKGIDPVVSLVVCGIWAGKQHRNGLQSSPNFVLTSSAVQHLALLTQDSAQSSWRGRNAAAGIKRVGFPVWAPWKLSHQYPHHIRSRKSPSSHIYPYWNTVMQSSVTQAQSSVGREKPGYFTVWRSLCSTSFWRRLPYIIRSQREEQMNG